MPRFRKFAQVFKNWKKIRKLTRFRTIELDLNRFGRISLNVVKIGLDFLRLGNLGQIGVDLENWPRFSEI